jgi:hypothetical protein
MYQIKNAGSGRGVLYNVETNELYLNSRANADKANECVIVGSRKNLIERYGLAGMITIANKFNLELQDHWTAQDLAEVIWNKWKEIALNDLIEERRLKRIKDKEARAAARRDRNTGDQLPVRRGRTRQPRNYRVHREAISNELRPLSGSKLPKQAKAMLDGVRSQPNDLLTEDELRELIFNLAHTGRLTGHNGKPLAQSPWRIWQYYEDKLHRLGLVTREFIYD